MASLGLPDTPPANCVQNCFIWSANVGELDGKTVVEVAVWTVGVPPDGLGLICLAWIISRLRLVPAGQQVISVIVGVEVGLRTETSVASTTFVLVTS